MMKIFRQKYLYNPSNAIYTSENVRTYNCMDTETKNKRLILIEHLKQIPSLPQSLGILQPIESPTSSQPFSVYALVRCISEIQRVSEPDAMYIVKCVQESKLEKPKYMVISDQGVCCSDVEGILPNPSPSLSEVVGEMLGLPQNLDFDRSILSKQGFAIYKALLNNENVLSKIQKYGWKDSKRDNPTDLDFIIFKGRRKEDGPFGDEYGLAWNNDHGLAKVKIISLTRDGYEEHFMKEYLQLLQYFEKTKSQNNVLFLKHLKFVKQQKYIKIFTQIANQGSLSDFITNKLDQNQPLTQKNSLQLLQNFASNMSNLCHNFKLKGLGTLHIRNIHVHNNNICIGEPLFLTDTIEKKLRESQNVYDYFAPQMKSNIVLYQNFQRLSKQKMDIWFFGMMLHKVFARQIPVFNASKKPNLNKEKISAAMNSFIAKCLDLNPDNRPSWVQVDLKQLDNRYLVIEEVKEESRMRQSIRLGARSQRMSQLKSPAKQQKVIDQLQQSYLAPSPAKQTINQKSFQNHDKSIIQASEPSQQQVQYESITQQQIDRQLIPHKLGLKIFIIAIMYIFIFFRPMIFSTIAIIYVRSTYATASLHLVNYSGERVSTSVVLTSNPSYFLDNSITFSQLQNDYQCVDNNFDPVNNPSYSLINYVQSGGFLALLLTGWLTVIIIIILKAVAIWKGGISHIPQTQPQKYIGVYVFFELTMAMLLFAHFFIYQFFYFAGATPCLSIKNFQGLQPFFDSSLYLFLGNSQMFFQQIFSNLGILAILLFCGACFYAFTPRLDIKYIFSFMTIFLKFIPFFLIFLICRIGVFGLFSPTAINDDTQIIPTMMRHSFQGFVGIVPQIFIIFTVTVEVLLQFFAKWVGQKTLNNPQLINFFGIKKEDTNQYEEDLRLNENYAFQQSNEKLQIVNLDP